MDGCYPPMVRGAAWPSPAGRLPLRDLPPANRKRGVSRFAQDEAASGAMWIRAW